MTLIESVARLFFLSVIGFFFLSFSDEGGICQFKSPILNDDQCLRSKHLGPGVGGFTELQTELPLPLPLYLDLPYSHSLSPSVSFSLWLWLPQQYSVIFMCAHFGSVSFIVSLGHFPILTFSFYLRCN